jgi:hypothetical protein
MNGASVGLVVLCIVFYTRRFDLNSLNTVYLQVYYAVLMGSTLLQMAYITYVVDSNQITIALLFTVVGLAYDRTRPDMWPGRGTGVLLLAQVVFVVVAAEHKDFGWSAAGVFVVVVSSGVMGAIVTDIETALKELPL